jgi:hypothetical protein
MIVHKCSLVLCLRDCLTGRALAANSVRALVNGEAVRAQFRDGGYMVFTGLEPGGYEIELRGGRYEPAVFTQDVPETGYRTRVVGLMPRARSGGGTGVMADGAEYFVPDGGVSLRLAQESSAAGDTQVLVHTGGTADMPATFLFGEGEGAEFCTAEYIRGGELTFSLPLTKPHTRGETLKLAFGGSIYG